MNLASVNDQQEIEMTNFFKHANALVESDRIGHGTRVWAFTHILSGARIGDDCNICDFVFIENDVIIGNRVTVKCGVQLWDGVRLEDDVFIGPNVTFTNDHFPRSKQYPAKFLTTIIRNGASIGANATILPGITIGRKAMVGAGSVVTRDVPPHAIVVGNPAHIIGYDQTQLAQFASPPIEKPDAGLGEFPVQGVKLIHLPMIEDMRGNLSVAEIEKGLPFTPKRCFWVFDVPDQRVRGEHAHREQFQFIVCVKGSLSILVDDGNNRAEVQLNQPNRGILIPPMVWSVQYKYSGDAVELVFASDKYESSEYIRDYDEYLKLQEGK